MRKSLNRTWSFLLAAAVFCAITLFSATSLFTQDAASRKQPTKVQRGMEARAVVSQPSSKAAQHSCRGEGQEGDCFSNVTFHNHPKCAAINRTYPCTLGKWEILRCDGCEGGPSQAVVHLDVSPTVPEGQGWAFNNLDFAGSPTFDDSKSGHVIWPVPENWTAPQPKHHNWFSRHPALTGLIIGGGIGLGFGLKNLHQQKCTVEDEYASGTPWNGPGFVNGCPKGQSKH